ncbi:hypothetical protein BZG00_02100 [Salinivibrio kushneri]|uniref:HNH endonuclease n=1 Tax=Salinivibrio kushneri TaxID=1908198 RepID=A0AB36K328_9GAMM|nr:hypothetical protein [Salinivibrio kushneri]OOE41781.1 hypothetical protein BZG00_02100 [Salinivibrio kushneri]QCP02330.1 hypothetical protein FCN78_07920 [Salinivibrio kushneri]
MKLNNGNIIDSNGKTTFVSISAFASEVCNLDVCFLCTKRLDANNQNDEHVIPKWLLKRFDLYNETVNLPNGSKFKYNQYVIPCCIECNSLLSSVLETPLSRVFSDDFEQFTSLLNDDICLKIYIWLALIFTKTHIMDQSLRMHLDRRIEYSSIADGVGYNWESFHHVYCLSRIPYTQASLDEFCIGSFFVIPVDSRDTVQQYDYMDISFANTSGIIINGIGIIAVFGDAGAVINQLNKTVIEKLIGPVTSIQFRELVANFACCHLHLKNSPIYSTLTDVSGVNPPQIVCKLTDSEPEFDTYDPNVFGALMDMLVGDVLDGKVNEDDFREKLRAGTLSILFDSHGHVIPPNKSNQQTN